MLVGREAELAGIRDVLATLSGSGACTVLELVGEPGIGKSVLLTRMLAMAGERDARILAAKATNAAGAPFGALVDALEDVVAEHGDWRDSMPEADLAALADIFPGLCEFRGARTARHHIHRAVRGLLEKDVRATRARARSG